MLDDASMSKVGFAMGCIAFSDDDLDACLLDIHELLSRLDQALHEAAKLEDAGDYPEAAADAERLEHLRSSTAKVMRSRGFGARYYTFLAQSEQA